MVTRYAYLIVVVFGGFGLIDAATADDNQRPLFVSPSGRDNGSCQNAAAPCRTIGYALRRVGKNEQIRVAVGTFELSAVEDIVYMLSGAIDVRGGFGTSDLQPGEADARTTLVGAPFEFAGALKERGFRIIADRKGDSREVAARTQSLIRAQASIKSSTTATPCSGGFAGVYPCSNVNLLAHVADRTSSATVADIWGFMDLNSNREYALVGYSTGTAVFDVSNPETPREVGFIDGQATTWRDIKVYQAWEPSARRWNAYAYVTADNVSDGLLVVDLTKLPHTIGRINYASDFAAAHNVHLTNTDLSTGLALDDDTPLLVLAGANRGDGRFRSYALSDPASPTFLATPITPSGQPGNDRLYMHDAASMRLGDARKDSQCANAGAAGYCDVLFDFNEASVDIWDISDALNPVRLSKTSYVNADYVHSGWWSEDQLFLFVQDETDERDRGLLTTLRIFSISDLTAPTLVGTWSGPTTAIDHNGFVRGNRYYMSNYARGLTILDITNPANPAAVGGFDTYPASDTVGFPGAWGTYPYLPSGALLISDIDSGLYIVEDKTRDVAAGTIAFAERSFGIEEGQPGSVIVRRGGGSLGAVSVDWQLIGASGTRADVALDGGTLSWDAGDSSGRTIELSPPDDGIAEGIERLQLKLVAPGGGATLSSPSIASVYVSDPGDSAMVGFMEDSVSIAERGFATAVAVVQRSGSATGPASVEFSVGNGSASPGVDYVGPSSGSIAWQDGDADPKWIEFTISDDGSGEADEFFEIQLGNASGASLGATSLMRVEILDGNAVNQAPNAVAASSQGAKSGDLVTLNGSQSNDPDGDGITYAWTQSLGPAVTLQNAAEASTTFVAPEVSSDTLLRFELRVSDPGGLSDATIVNVTVSNGSANFGSSGGGPVTPWLLSLLGLLAAMRATTRKDVS